MYFQTISYFGSDFEDEQGNLEYLLKIFGRREDGSRVTLTVKNFEPFFYVRLPEETSKCLKEFKYYLESLDDDKKLFSKYEIVDKKKDIFGFQNEECFTFVKFFFRSKRNFFFFRKFWKGKKTIGSYTFVPSLYESDFDTVLSFIHENHLKTSSWHILEGGGFYNILDYSREEDRKKFKVCEEGDTQVPDSNAPFTQFSWDIETYSHDYSFPRPHVKQNVIYQIGVHVSWNNENPEGKDEESYLLTLKKTPKGKEKVSVDERGNAIKILEFETEVELLRYFGKMIKEVDPDIMYTYNGDMFDCQYVSKRCEMLGINESFYEMISRVPGKPAYLNKQTFKSSAYGDQDFERWIIPGRISYDLCIHFRRGMKKFDNYKLDTISNVILGTGKHPVTAKDIFKFYEDGDPEKILTIGEYCVNDCVLLQQLVDNQKIFTNIMALSSVTFVPPEFLVTRGQTIKVMSQLYRKAHDMNFLIPHQTYNDEFFPIAVSYVRKGKTDVLEDILENGEGKDFSFFGSNAEVLRVVDGKFYVNKYFREPVVKKFRDSVICAKMLQDDLDEDAYTGATVIEPEKGFYDEPILVMDFASLYPTIMMSRNLCLSTIVLHDKYKGIEGVEYEEFKWKDMVPIKINKECEAVYGSGKNKGLKCQRNASVEREGNWFCKIHDKVKTEYVSEREVDSEYSVVQSVKGVIPSLLEELYSERKKVKKRMKTAKSQTEYTILDGTQLAIKVSLNSIYGFMGRKVGNLKLKALASIVTAVGRQQIDYTKELAEEHGPRIMKGEGTFHVIYGDTDSVFLKVIEKVKHTNQELFDFGSQFAKECTEIYMNRKPMELEFEKMYKPFILMTKKRYVGFKYDNFKNPEELSGLTKSGIAMTRRNYCPLVKECYQEILDEIENGFPGGKDKILDIFLKGYIEKILKNEVPLEKLYLSGELARNYKTPTPHFVVAEKKRKRGEEVELGERITYVFADIEGGSGLSKTEKAEDPEYMKENCIPYCRISYAQHICGPILGFLVTMFSDEECHRVIDKVNEIVQENYKDKKLKKSELVKALF